MSDYEDYETDTDESLYDEQNDYIDKFSHYYTEEVIELYYDIKSRFPYIQYNSVNLMNFINPLYYKYNNFKINDNKQFYNYINDNLTEIDVTFHLIYQFTKFIGIDISFDMYKIFYYNYNYNII